MQSWESAFQQGKTNRLQSRFFSPKVQEELYDVREDPHNVHNLALDPVNITKVQEFRKKVTDQMLKTYDTGVIPEALMIQLSAGSTPYAYTHDLGKHYSDILNAAIIASAGKRENLPQLRAMLSNDHPAIRYWGATGSVILQEGAMELKDPLIKLLDDEFITVRIAAAEALYELGETDRSVKTLRIILDSQFTSQLNKENETEGYAPEVFELTHALNVITFFDDKGYSLRKEIDAIAGKEKSDYAKRAAEYLMARININQE